MSSLAAVPSVLFLETLDQYPWDTDLICKFKYNLSSGYQAKDFVAIFKLGWFHIKETVSVQHVFQNAGKEEFTAVFSGSELPKNTLDLYQVCYLRGHELLGATTPFQFCSPDEPVNNYSNLLCLVDKDQEISKLREENAVLRKSLKTLLSRDCNEDIREIKDLIAGIKAVVSTHDKEIAMLKAKIIEGGLEYRKLYLEKHNLEKKYEKKKNAEMKHVNVSNNQLNDFDFDLGELESLPPFPQLK